jgi:hypothetical protein
MRERVRVRGKCRIMQQRRPLIRPSATFSLMEKVRAANENELGKGMKQWTKKYSGASAQRLH